MIWPLSRPCTGIAHKCLQKLLERSGIVGTFATTNYQTFFGAHRGSDIATWPSMVGMSRGSKYSVLSLLNLSTTNCTRFGR